MSNLAQKSNVLRSQEEHITQTFDEIEGRVTKKLFPEFDRPEKNNLGALTLLDNFLMNKMVQGHSETTPDTSRNTHGTKQGTNANDSQSYPHPEAGIFQSRTTQSSGLKKGHDMVTGVHEEVTYSSFSEISGKQKKNRSTSQPQFLLQQSWKQSCNNRSRPHFVGPSAVGKKQHFCNFP